VNGAAEGLRWLTLLDGVPVVRRANALTGRRWSKLSGSDLINPVLESAAVLGARVGFLGGAVDTHRRLRELVGQRLPAIRIAGTWAPTRRELTDAAASERIAAEIRDADVDILVVALSSHCRKSGSPASDRPLERRYCWGSERPLTFWLVVCGGHQNGSRERGRMGMGVDARAPSARPAPFDPRAAGVVAAEAHGKSG
jgi:hypothetical protein